ncbi:MAG: UpxY family transcription antiterminator [Bacteroides sp.]|nr:UpxY family transcription antiterminator [Bacteroides sp.]
MTDSTLSTLHWFALKVFYNKVFEIEDTLKKENIETYIPCEESLSQRGETKKVVRKPIINSLMFFRATDIQALEVQQRLLNRVILYAQKEGFRKVPFHIPDREMNIFMLVSSSGQSGLEYFEGDQERFYLGDRVRVTDGPFKDAEGHICRIRGSRRLIVTIRGVCAIATSYIPQCFLQRI